jgi:hypothetical protein
MQEEQACSIFFWRPVSPWIMHGRRRPEYVCKYYLQVCCTVHREGPGPFLHLKYIYFSRALDGVHDYSLVVEHTHAAAASAWLWRLCVDQILLSQPHLSLLKNFVSGDPPAAS